MITLTKEFIDKSIIIHNNFFDYSLVNYKNSYSKVTIICPKHGKFEQPPYRHLRGSGCNGCRPDKISKTMMSNKENFINKASLIHYNKYDYSLVNYLGSFKKIKIICQIHGQFEQMPNSHLNGKGCKKCAILNSRTTISEFIYRCNLLFNNKYNYSKTSFNALKDKVIIICPSHGEFLQMAGSHFTGTGCKKCYADSKKIKLSDFILRSNLLHNYKFDYSLVNYYRNNIKIKIICPTHGVFEQTPQNHLSRHGCEKCTSSISKIESIWLDNLNIPTEYRQKTIYIDNNYYRVDAYDNKENTIYEFYGDFWHGNPNKFKLTDINPLNNLSYKELYDNTIKRNFIFEKAGYKLITIWESEFNKQIKNSRIRKKNKNEQRYKRHFRQH